MSVLLQIMDVTDLPFVRGKPLVLAKFRAADKYAPRRQIRTRSLVR
jgi:hypothetical protein